jgi:phosphate transport system permease protein
MNPHNLKNRYALAVIWNIIFNMSTAIAILVLAILVWNVLDQSFGYIVIQNKVDPLSLSASGAPLDMLSAEELTSILQEGISSGLFKRLERDKPIAERTQSDLAGLVMTWVVQPEVKQTWTLWDTLMKRGDILKEVQEKYPNSKLEFKSWVTLDFLFSPQSGNPMAAGVRTAILGSLWIILITILVAFPLGVGAAIYLEEYAGDHWINRVIQTNINNLAGVPSIIYGILGLAIFVRTFDFFTSGTAFGIVDPTTANGRTILSGGMTLALLVLPVIIINAQEAIRAVPNSLRQASYGLGATQWQTVWYHVLPNAIPGIMTGTILAVSRAIGETAPLVVIGAATYITFDPEGFFSKFTTLPVQIYQWTTRPQSEFHNLAAAAIMVLLGMLLSLNAVAILLRNRYGGQHL